MVKSGHCLQQMQRKEGQQNSQAAGVETEKDSVGEQASAMMLLCVFASQHSRLILPTISAYTSIGCMVQAPSAWQVGVLVGMERDGDNSPKVLAWHDCRLKSAVASRHATAFVSSLSLSHTMML